MGHRITLIAPAYTEADRKDRSLEPFCEEVIKIDSVRTRKEVEKIKKTANILSGRWGL